MTKKCMYSFSILLFSFPFPVNKPLSFYLFLYLLYLCRYNYHFPFLKTRGMLGIEDNRMHPLYKHVFQPMLAPWLSFGGITNKVKYFIKLKRKL